MFKQKKYLRQIGDQQLLKEITKLQRQIKIDQETMQNSYELSPANVVQSQISRQKYTFLYQEARRRDTRAKTFGNVIVE